MSIIGIDLGTTNSSVSCFIDKECIIIPNALGENLTPSVVSVLKSGEFIVGGAAKERLITNPQLTASVFKRYMGTNKKYKLGKYDLTPTELSSIVIKSLKSDAESYLNTEIKEAVISVPAYFNDKQRRATKQAGEMAGLKVERLINEPSAASLAYGLQQNDDEKKFLVFDFGGGTFDVSILDLFDNLLEIRAVAGNNFLGGEDFNELLIKHLLEHLGIELSSLDLKVISAIKKQAEECKIALTTAEKFEMNCCINKNNYALTITNDEFENMSQELLFKLKKPLLRVLSDASMNTQDLDEIILVGGSTKMPIVRSFVAKMFGRLPLCHLNPDEVVALGAGIYAAMKERNEYLRETVLTDVCPYTLGTAVAVTNQFGEYDTGVFLPIIERNNTVPYSKVERLYTLYDNQTCISVEIYQGEHRLVENNLKLGEINIFVPPAPAGQSAIDLRYTYDINGILEVEVTSLETDEKKREVIVNSETEMTTQEIEKRLQEIQDIKIHPRDNAKNRYLLEKAERLYEETLSDLRMEISRAINRFEAALNKQNPKEIRKEVKLFEEFLKEIEYEGL
ncbi:molecular chaperone HscC [Herbivorax sp. ANBcel31]|uniref:Hsp70 family protein n=1 Tax=Herbivorax sp. ANBcel31 TaxID=3069754 RepID=UPI0027B4E2D3|nr:molecular chaperone HscC [Herbivorax sp. ANBcel31]MDQ2085081.1 molecular chaperone HscC [Herbivorax sp. ANBcel31]